VIRVALPRGDLRKPTAALLEQSGLPLPGYASGARELRFTLDDRGLAFRVFREEDIPVQVALGNYDIGICDLTWIREQLIRYPNEGLVPLRDLGFGRSRLVVAVPGQPSVPATGVRIVTQHPNIAEAMAVALRLPRYRVLPVWGAAEAYPPEDADVALVAVSDGALDRAGLREVHTVLESSAWLVANRRALTEKWLSVVLGPLLAMGGRAAHPRFTFPSRLDLPAAPATAPREVFRIALPDGHAQRHTAEALRDAGIEVEGYGETAERRLRVGIPGVEVKVIRPQDMPQQVALGQFDLAITGRDWLLSHLYQFPSSPVRELVDLRRSRYVVAAAVHETVPANTLEEALRHWRARGIQIVRVASEYANIADHFARDRRLGRYRVIPVTGASEAFVPEDAEILVEGTETGSSFRANRLKILETILESTACLIGPAVRPPGKRGELFDAIVERFRASVQATAMAGGR
jgi:ATP phosphoribosyltransferase